MTGIQAREKILFKQEDLSDLFLRRSELKNLYLFTVNYSTAPVVIREKFAIPEYLLEETIKGLKKYSSIESFLVLSTCNRTEIYFVANNRDLALDSIYNYFEKHFNIEPKLTKEYSNVINNINVVKHTFNVACGLDSLVLGEAQVLSQLISAYSIAQKEKTLNNSLELLLQAAIKCARKVHKETDISKNCQSISSAAIDLANKVTGPIKTKSVMVLGAGKMAKLALEHINKLGGAKETVVLNRSPHRIIEFPEEYKITRSIAFENIYEAINDVDIIVAATGAPHFIIFAEQFKEFRKDINKPLDIFDISMPRNIDSEFGKLENIKLYDIDTLQTIYKEMTKTSSEDLKLTHKIILESIEQFDLQIANLNVDSLIKDLKEKIEKIRKEKLMKLKRNKSTFTAEEIDYITKNIINTVLHGPVKNLKKSATNQKEKINIIKELFNSF